MPTDAKVFIGNRSSKNMSQFVEMTCDGDPKANPPCFYLYVGLKMGLNPVCPAVLTQYQHVVNSDLFNHSLSRNLSMTLFLSKISNWEKNQHRCPGKLNNKNTTRNVLFLRLVDFLMSLELLVVEAGDRKRRGG